MFRTTLAALVAIVITTSAQAANLESTIKQTAWIGETTDSSGKKVATAMTFREDGAFFFFLDVGGGKIEKLEGTYTIEGDLIKLSVMGNNLTLEVVSFDSKSLVTSGKSGKIKWDRIPPKNQQ